MTGLYVYGIVRSAHPTDLGALVGVGDPPSHVRAVQCGPLKAAVSNAPDDLRGKRRDLVAHQRVLETLLAAGTVLPMRFGVAAPDEATLRRTLESAGATYERLMSELDGRVELNVKSRPDEQELLEEVAVEEPAIRALREATTHAGGGTYEQRLRLGQLVADALGARRQRYAEQVLARLRPLAERSALGPPVHGCALNAAFLVARDSVDPFATAVQALDEESRRRLRLRLTGPLPPYSFVPAG